MNNYEPVLQQMAEYIQLQVLSLRTLETYSSHAPVFLAFSHNPVADLDAEDIHRFLFYMTHEKKASRTPVKVHGASIFPFFALQ